MSFDNYQNYRNLGHYDNIDTEGGDLDMGEEKTFSINDTYRAIESVSSHLKSWESPKCDPRVKAMILTKLQEARLLSLELVIQE